MFSWLTGKRADLNNDAKQRKLVELFIAHGRGTSISPVEFVTTHDGRTYPMDVTNFIIVQDWTPRETRNRIAHALSVVKMTVEPPVYEKAKSYGRSLAEASYRLE